MATCRECLHYDACKMFYITILPKAPLLTDGTCDNFTQKSDYVKRERGEWKRLKTDEHYWYECSICGNVPLRHQFSSTEFLSDFCPYCGADMRKEDNNER